MSLIRSIPGLFEWGQFEPEVILLAVGWYLRFSSFVRFERCNVPFRKQINELTNHSLHEIYRR